MEGRDIWSQAGFAGYVHDHISRTIGQFDTKVSILMGFAAAALAFDIDNLKALPKLLEVFDYPAYFSALTQLDPEQWKEFLGLLSAFCLAVAFGSAMWCLRPRSGPSKGVIYFRGVAAHANGQEYAAMALSIAEDDVAKAILADAYALSRIAQHKARSASVATWALCMGLVLLLATLAAHTMLPLPDTAKPTVSSALPSV